MSFLSSAVSTATGGTSTLWIAVIAFGIGAGAGGYVTHRWDADALTTEKLAHVSDMKAVSDAAATALVQHQAERDRLTADLAAADAQHFKELTDAKVENDSLRAAATAGSLSIATTADGGCGVPSSPAPAVVGHAAPRRRAVIDPGAANALVAIAADADRLRAQVRELQAYARAVSTPPTGKAP